MSAGIPTGKAWIRQIFDADAVPSGGIVRRKKSDVDKFATYSELLNEVKSRSYHLIETGDQYVKICNPGVIMIHC